MGAATCLAWIPPAAISLYHCCEIVLQVAAFWCNGACQKRLGKLFTLEEQAKVTESLPEPVQKGMATALTRLYEDCVVSLARLG